jgi:hypothetical protein
LNLLENQFENLSFGGKQNGNENTLRKEHDATDKVDDSRCRWRDVVENFPQQRSNQRNSEKCRVNEELNGN